MFTPPQLPSYISTRKAKASITKDQLVVVILSFLATLCILFWMAKLNAYQSSMVNAHSDFIEQGCHEQSPEFQKECWNEIVESRKASK